jgi:hypothetical protein
MARKKPPITREPTPRLLAFDSTPAGLITKSLRKPFGGVWGRLRREHFANGGLSCEVCLAVETEARLIHGHEVHSFPNPETVRLERVAFLCTRCHDAIHFERTLKYCRAPYLRTISDHYCKNNGGLSEQKFRQDYNDTFNKMLSIRKFYGGSKARPAIDYGPFTELVEKSMQRKQAWRLSYQGQMKTIEKFLYTSTESDDYVDGDWILETAADHEQTRQELATHLDARYFAAARAAIDDILSEIYADSDFEMLPDREYPQATAMWRDTFGS